MSQLAAINYPQLEEFLQNDGPTEEEVRVWYDKLAEYEIEGSESPPEIELLYNGARYLMGFGFTAAEELRNVAEQEAVTMAEKEDQWEEQKTALNLEIESLRDRITSKADVGDSTEAFRAQIDSLKEENRQLQQSNRDRDREMADQRDRFENLASRVDTLTRERDALSEHKAQLEDTIRELNRRLSAKTEDTGAEWESKKLKLRNEQVLTISRQMQAVVSQNEELREEIDRVSYALEEATRIIEQSAVRYTEMTNKLEISQLRIEELFNQNRRLTQILPEELVEHVSQCISAAETMLSGRPIDKVNFLIEVGDLLAPKFLNEDDKKALEDATGLTEAEEQKEKLERAEDRVKGLQDELNAVVEESNKMRTMIREDRTGEKEQELEQLKKELVDATTLARNLFGEAMSEVPGQDPTMTLQMRILQLEHSIEQLNDEKEKQKKVMEELQFTIEQKDENNGEVLSELNRLKDAKFGSAREEITRLEKQMKFRDEQIGKLQQHCTLLQVELGRYAEGTYEPIVKPSLPRRIRRPDMLLATKTVKPEIQKIDSPVAPSSPLKPSPRVIEDEPRNAPNAPNPKEPPRFVHSGDYSDIAQQAVLISNLYYELMQLLEEISYKDEKLVEIHKSWKSTQKSYQEMKAQLEMAYGEIQSLKKENLMIEERTLEELKQTESVELQRLVESINVEGSEMERRLGEATRMLVTERMERMRFTRQCTILRTKTERLEEATRKSKEMLRTKELNAQRAIGRLKYEVETTTIEIGRLQTRLLQSVPTEEYDKLMRKYKRLIKETTGVETNNEEVMARQEMTVYAKSPVEAELEARENMLKKMIDVVSDQSDFWNQESAMLQAENEELKKFIEDVENESDLKSVLGAVERRLLSTIRELRENEREYLREKKKSRGNDIESSRDSERLRQERVALINVIIVLQRENKTLRDQAVGTVSLQQLELLRSNIFQARQKEAEIAAKMENIDKLKEESETEMLRIRALRTANEVLSNFDGHEMQPQGNNEVAERQLQLAYFTSSQQSAKAKQFERMVHLKEQRVAELNDEMRELKQWNLELITTLENIKTFKGERRESQHIKPEISLKPRESIAVDQLEDSMDKESDYEMDIKSETSSSEASSDRIIVRTIVQDNVDAFENRIKEIKASAQLAVQGYKEQLELKEIAIDRYKKLLREKIDEGVQIIEKVEIVHQEVEIPDRSTEEQLRKTEVKLKELESEMRKLKAKRAEIVKNDDEQDDVSERIERFKEFLDEEVQTEWEYPQVSSRLNNEEEVEQLPKSAKSEKVRRLEEEMQLLQELVAKSDSKDGENMRQKTEIRDLKARIQRLTKTNKELLVTCEQIKEDALAELSTFRRNNENSDERRMTDLRVELDRLRTTNRTLRNANEEMKNELSRLKQTVERRDTKNEPDEWERRKRQDEIIASLKEKLKKRDIAEKDYLEKLKKREMVIETMRNDQGLRSSEIERLQRKLKANDPSVIKLQLNKEWKEKLDVLEANITKKNEELTACNRTLLRLKSELETNRKRHASEIEKIRVDNNSNVQKEVKRAREEVKKAMTVIKPQMSTVEIQADLLEKRHSGSTKSHRSETVSHNKIELSTISSSSSSISSPASSSKSHRSKTLKSISRDSILEERRLSQKSFDEQPNIPAPKSDTSDYYQLRESLQMTQERLIESQEKLIQMERDYSSLHEKFDRLKLRFDRDEKPTGAVLVLSDKLAAKDREIAQLKNRIAHLQNTVHLPQ
ncbi:uncharacterized protein CELE_Y47G6A.17 [Caenorhabditis elegans]|uniref:CEntrosomal Protein n=1 Tax=Caenorhabditis elegans TaxID=6239 RepID=A2A266_CAEEL|nr:uncharacterized protein CELE_Y47G6A.17 [Caenorhabditis elegans]CCD72561.1 C. elegans CEntrosomal Protein [Caenorhabditis elegans]|eukprot:NP_491170.3 C. elegans CEntrosomal Protein [Caenorhabditis elegans]